MAKKYKLTGCARFFIFLAIFAPLVYFGVSYFKGEDPIAPLRNIELPKIIKNTPSNVTDESIINESMRIKELRIEDLEKENMGLKNQISTLEAENRRLKAPK